MVHRSRLRTVFLVVLLLAGVGRGHAQAPPGEREAVPHSDVRHTDVEVPFRHYTSADGLPSDFVTALAQSRDGLLWIGTAGGLSVYYGEEFRKVSFPDSVGNMGVDEIVAASDSTVWVSWGTVASYNSVMDACFAGSRHYGTRNYPASSSAVTRCTP